MPGGWAGSNRRAELPSDWYTVIRPRILERDGHQCQHELVTRPGQLCLAEATDVDHIGDRHDHSDDNLRALCGWHHDRRSSAQGNAAKRGRPWRPSERMPNEAHPGLL